MTEPLSPQAIEILAAGHVLGDLDPAEVEAFEQCLANNPTLTAEVRQLNATFDRILYDLNSTEPPAHLRSTILAAATTTSTKPKQRRLNWNHALGSVAAILILYLGIENYQLQQERKMAQEINLLLQQPHTQSFALRAVNATNSPAVGSFVVNLQQRQGVLSAQNLPILPAHQVYRLWAIAEGEKIPCGTLKIHPQGKVLEKFWMPADFYDTGISGLFVTVESSELGRYPTGKVVLESRLPSKIDPERQKKA
jgi:anti-sigma-K factor RskA